MNSTKLHRKYGIVILLDALGASEYSDEKIKEFLKARTEIHEIIKSLAASSKKVFGSEFKKACPPSIFTFGDTIIITIELRSKKFIVNHILGAMFLMRRYLYHAFENGILFRGAFSIGTYIEDAQTNTVLGEAVADAACWHEKAEWVGLSCTPKTNNVLEHYFREGTLGDPEYFHKYPVPLKSGGSFNLYTISWVGLFHDEHVCKDKDPRQWFFEILKEFRISAGVEQKFENTKNYFLFVRQEVMKKSTTKN